MLTETLLDEFKAETLENDEFEYWQKSNNNCILRIFT